MSGGHFNCEDQRVFYDLQEIAANAEATKRWPALFALIGEIANWFGPTVHDADRSISGDFRMVDTDERFERKRIVALLEVVMKAAPDDLFPRGKWATIQAIQEREANAP